jgi:hypothetical protein
LSDGQSRKVAHKARHRLPQYDTTKEAPAGSATWEKRRELEAEFSRTYMPVD